MPPSPSPSHSAQTSPPLTYLVTPLNRIPLYPYLRLLFLLYLVLPQTQGARIIYTTYVHPYLEDNESQIEELIATAHDKMKAAGMAYLKRAIELLRTQVLGIAPSPDAAHARSADAAVPASQRPRSYTQALLDRFQLPQGRWPVGGGGAVEGGAGSPGQDFYNFLASAVAAATGSGSGAAAETDPKSPSLFRGAPPDGGVGAFPSGDLTASGTLVPPGIRDDAAKMTFLAAQRERLSLVLSALDREAAALRSAVASGSGGSGGSGNTDNNLDENNRPATSASGKSGLSKSRSEADFEKIEAESDAEDNPAQDNDSARPTPAASGGSWMPWGWGGGGGGGSSSSSAAAAGEEKSKSE